MVHYSSGAEIRVLHADAVQRVQYARRACTIPQMPAPPFPEEIAFPCLL